jgi:hypothetical protein
MIDFCLSYGSFLTFSGCFWTTCIHSCWNHSSFLVKMRTYWTRLVLLLYWAIIELFSNLIEKGIFSCVSSFHTLTRNCIRAVKCFTIECTHKCQFIFNFNVISMRERSSWMFYLSLELRINLCSKAPGCQSKTQKLHDVNPNCTTGNYRFLVVHCSNIPLSRVNLFLVCLNSAFWRQ